MSHIKNQFGIQDDKAGNRARDDMSRNGSDRRDGGKGQSVIKFYAEFNSAQYRS